MADAPDEKDRPAITPELVEAELHKVVLPGMKGWMYCFGGLVDVRQAAAVLVGSVGDDDDDARYVVRVKLPSGESLTLRLGPYEKADIAHAVAKEVVERVFR